MKGYPRLPDAELEVMQALWAEESYPAHSGALMARLEDKGWQTPTLLKLLSRLEERGFVARVKEGRINGYTPLVSREDYLASESRSFVSRLHGGSVSALVATLWRDHALTEEDVAELKALLEKGEM